jgi:SAM-dependent methyltransferase
MGLDINAVQFLIAAHQRGVHFNDVLMIGRQDLNVYPARMAQVLQRAGLSHAAFQAAGGDTLYAEPLFHSLGANKVSSLDASAFEGAQVVHDLNLPIGADLQERFDLVYDGGTLEHVFNFPIALKNCMEMVRPGGWLILHTVANNYCGHGFYQFSPELFFRALSPENGFEVERMVLHRIGPYGGWYEVTDPEKIRSRVELVTFMPVQLLVQAKRVRVAPIFAKTPQQSDYTPRWTDQEGGPPAGTPVVDYSPSRPRLAGMLPGVARLVHVLKMGLALYRNQTLHNRKCFRPVKKP